MKWLLIFLLSCLTGCAGFSFIRTPLGPMEDRVPQEYRAVFATQLVWMRDFASRKNLRPFDDTRWRIVFVDAPPDLPGLCDRTHAWIEPGGRRLGFVRGRVSSWAVRHEFMHALQATNRLPLCHDMTDQWEREEGRP